MKLIYSFKKGSIGMNEPQVLLEKSSTKKESSHSKIMENFLFVRKMYLQNFSTKRKILGWFVFLKNVKIVMMM